MRRNGWIATISTCLDDGCRFGVRLFTLVYVNAEVWRALSGVAARDHGLITTAQIHKLGLSRQALRTFLGQGRLEREERGLYRLVGNADSWQSTVLAHCWATGGRAFGTTAAMVHELGSPADLSPGYAEVLVPLGARPRPRPRLTLHRGADWEYVRTENVDHIPVVPLAETLLSVAMHHPFEKFRSVVNQARRQRRITLPQLTQVAEPFLGDGRRHRRQLKAALECLTEQPTLSRSEWSDEFADWCEQRGLPRPELEFRITDANGVFIAQVDLCWPKHGLVVELDSWAWHHDRASFESDRRRYARLAVEGWTVIAVTWKRWKGEPDGLAKDLAMVLNNRRTA